MFAAPNRDDLRKIVILNPKGGCGKTTLATNLASYFALQGPTPTLIDADPIGFTTRWLQKRPQNRSRINGISVGEFASHGKRTWHYLVPKEAGPVIVDTPAALNRRAISELTYDADCILVPILPSAFDVQVTAGFIAQLLLLTEFDRPVAIVANRTRKNTRSLAALLEILKGFETPTIAVLRDSQNYVHAAELGLGIHELPPHRARQDTEQLDLVVNWLDNLLVTNLQPGLMSGFSPLQEIFSPASVELTGTD